MNMFFDLLSGPDLGEDGGQVDQRRAGDDLGSLHGLAGGDVERSHVIANIPITDDRKNPCD